MSILGIRLHENADNNRYVTADSRLRTYEHWPRGMPMQDIDSLVAAGFFYVGAIQNY